MFIVDDQKAAFGVFAAKQGAVAASADRKLFSVYLEAHNISSRFLVVMIVLIVLKLSFVKRFFSEYIHRATFSLPSHVIA